MAFVEIGTPFSPYRLETTCLETIERILLYNIASESLKEKFMTCGIGELRTVVWVVKELGHAPGWY